MNVNFNGFGENVLTFMAGPELKVAGVPVYMYSDGTVNACSDGNAFCGICVGVRNGYAAVQVSGYVELAAESKIAVGYQKLVSGGENIAEVGTAGKEYLVVSSTDNTVGFIL
ncbi:MAG: hypothetical protein U0L20_08115 [Ruminococcus sp.]|nr:hypothetical protein [Ruminococcus sp.]